MIKNCAICGRPFETNLRNQKYCSKACAHVQGKRSLKKYRQKWREIGHIEGEMKRPSVPICLACNKPFVQHFPNEKFCSDTCRLDFFSLTAVEKFFDFIRF